MPIGYYKENNHLVILNPMVAGTGIVYSLNQATVNTNIANQLTITIHQQIIQIIFPNNETRTLFLKGVLRYVLVIITLVFNIN